MVERGAPDFSSAPFIFDKKGVFEVVARVNERRPFDRQIGVEFYPGSNWPWILTAEKALDYSRKYGVKIVRVHLPFQNDLRSAKREYIRVGMDLRERVIGLGLLYVLGTVVNMNALKIAEKTGAEVNAHVTVIEQAAKRGNIEVIKSHAPGGVFVENEGSFAAAVSNKSEIKKVRNDVRSIKAVRDNGLSGFIFGADHAFGYGIDPIAELRSFSGEYKAGIRSIHVAGSGHHGLLDKDDEKLRSFVDYADSDLPISATFCVDLSPFAMRSGGVKVLGVDYSDQARLVESQIAILEKAA